MTLEFQPFQEGDKAGMMDVASAMMSSGTGSATKAEIAEEIEFPASFNASATGFLRAPCPSTPTPCSRLWRTPF